MATCRRCKRLRCHSDSDASSIVVSMTLRNSKCCARAGFTLLEVLIAIAVLALLSLEHQDLQSVIRGQEVSRAAMLAQALMTQAELQRFPPLGTSSGDFDRMYSGRYPNFRWTRSVQPSPVFPDLRKVEIHVL